MQKSVVSVYKDANVRNVTFFVEMVAVCSNLEFEPVCSRWEFLMAWARAMFENVHGKPVVHELISKVRFAVVSESVVEFVEGFVGPL